VANAQYAPTGPVPGSGDSTKVSNSNQENNPEYNPRVGANDAKANPASGEKVKSSPKSGPLALAEIKPGASLRDSKGAPIGTIDSVTDQQVIVSTGQTKIGVPLIAFGKDDKGLLLSITAQQFNDAIAKAHARAQAKQQAQPPQESR
jgi:hypothetical protein